MTVTIQFKLPQGAGGLAAGFRAHQLKQRIQAWSDEYHIPCQCSSQKKYIFIVSFNQQTDLTVFAMTWEQSTYWDKWYQL